MTTNTYKSSIKLTDSQTLTGSYVVTSTQGSFSTKSDSLDVLYTTGAAETGTNLTFKIEHSYDESSWVQESYTDLQSSVDTLTPIEHRVKGGAGGTQYTAQYIIPVCSKYIRVSVKEDGVNSNFGSVTIIMTTTPASGQIRNLQKNSSITESTFNYKSETLTSGSTSVTGTTLSIRAFANGADATFNIDGGDTITIRQDSGLDVNLRSTLEDPTINWVSGTIDLFIEYIT